MDTTSVINFLNANSDKLVSEVLAELTQMLRSAPKLTSTNYAVDGKVVAIYCYYHKKWEPISECEYGAKASSTTGLNTMCKEGNNQWCKENRDSKAAKALLLEDVAAGKVQPDQIAAEMNLIEAERAKIVPREDKVGFDTLDELKEYLAESEEAALTELKEYLAEAERRKGAAPQEGETPLTTLDELKEYLAE